MALFGDLLYIRLLEGKKSSKIISFLCLSLYHRYCNDEIKIFKLVSMNKYDQGNKDFNHQRKGFTGILMVQNLLGQIDLLHPC